jgi:hypothetical protein
MKSMHKLLKWTKLFLLFTLLFSCKSKPVILTEDRPMNSFTHLYIKDVFDIYFYDCPLNKIVVEADENVLKNIKTLQDNDSIFITNTSKFRWTKKNIKPKIHVYTDSIKQIFLTEASIFTATTPITTDSLFLYVIADLCEVNASIHSNVVIVWPSETSVCNVNLTGHTNYLFILGYYGAMINCENLLSQETVVWHRGAGDIYTHTQNNLSIYLTGTGRLFYKPSPTLFYLNDLDKSKVIALE